MNEQYFAVLRADLAKAKLVLIIGHRHIDMDCLVSMLLVREGIRKILKYSGQIRFAFTKQGYHLPDYPIHPNNRHEVSRDGVIYFYVDCGGAGFDHHREGNFSNGPSCTIVDRVFGISETIPEWARIVDWARQADEAALSGASVPRMLDGAYLLLGEGNDIGVFWFGRRIIEALVAKDRKMVEAKRIPISIVESGFALPNDPNEPTVQVRSIANFGPIGLIIGDEEHGGTQMNRLTAEGCRIVISFGTKKGKTGILIRRNEDLDLLEIGIVARIREAETLAREVTADTTELRKRGKVLGWFTMTLTDGQVIGLLNGSKKTELTPEERSRIGREDIIDIVIQQITASASAT